MRFFPVSSNLYKKIGLLPVTYFYYEPFEQLNTSQNRKSLAIDFQFENQKQLLNQFRYKDEVLKFPIQKNQLLDYFYKNGSYEFGDAEVLYQMVRYIKPKRIIEIGSGYSTLMTLEAIKANQIDDAEYNCEFSCIEPYEFGWLESKPIELIRKKVEDIDLSFFSTLKENDILFIDSSHVVRPQGDVLYEFLHILPSLSKGVIIHIHDIFTPNHYPADWINKEFRLWHEQYFLEAFLTGNDHFQVLLSLNYLHQLTIPELYEACPMLKQHPDAQPGAFWIQKVK